MKKRNNNPGLGALCKDSLNLVRAMDIINDSPPPINSSSLIKLLDDGANMIVLEYTTDASNPNRGAGASFYFGELKKQLLAYCVCSLS
jgi:hypothetical protein